MGETKVLEIVPEIAPHDKCIKFYFKTDLLSYCFISINKII